MDLFKRRLAQFNGIASRKFLLNSKESEFRFNYRNHDFYAKMVRENFYHKEFA